MEYKALKLTLKNFINMEQYLSNCGVSWGQHGKDIRLDGNADKVNEIYENLYAKGLVEKINIIRNIVGDNNEN